MVRSSNLRRAAAALAGPPAGPALDPAVPLGLAAPAPGAEELEVTAALVAGLSDAEDLDEEAIPAWMEGEADTAADSI